MPIMDNTDLTRVHSELRKLSGLSETEGNVVRALDFRKSQLNNLARMLEENQNDLTKALHHDLGRAPSHSRLMDISPVLSEIHLALRSLDSWTAKEHAPKSISSLTDKLYVSASPKGLVLIIGPWNYPLQLLLAPLVGAIAAGNIAFVKPSEVSGHVASLVGNLLRKYMDPRCVYTFEGGSKETEYLLTLKFDHIFFTGSTKIGRLVYMAAARNLTPVTLELGGKCPVIVHESANIRNAARRVVFGKFLNCGQTCIAPDFVVLPASLQEMFSIEVVRAVCDFYGLYPKNSVDFSRIINKTHYTRLYKLICEFNAKSNKGQRNDDEFPGHCVYGGKETCDLSTMYIPPTIVVDVGIEANIMKEEIFGPILPILPIYSDFEDSVVSISMAYGSPLAVYVFADNAAFLESIKMRTKSGAFVVNDTVMQVMMNSVPFGGIGDSGIGKYHGKYTFDEFSHSRTVLERSSGIECLNSLRYSPLSAVSEWILDKVLFYK